MQEGQLLMTQADRDRLVTLRKAKKRLITQKQAAEELGLSVRQVKRLVYALKKRGDKAVIHGLRGKPSNQRIAKTVEEEAMQILSADLYQGFGPTLASEYLADKHDIEVSKETLRQWMIRAKLWRAKEQKVKAVHVWRPRRSRFGELVQWDTSEHDWLDVSDRHDRRRHQPAVCTVRAARHDRGEHEAAVALRGEVRAAAGVLYGQGQYLPNGGEAQAG
jgi:transposase